MQSQSRIEKDLDQDIDDLIRQAQESQPELTEEEKEGFETDEEDESDEDENGDDDDGDDDE